MPYYEEKEREFIPHYSTKKLVDYLEKRTLKAILLKGTNEALTNKNVYLV